MPKPSPAVRWLLLINVAAFVTQLLLDLGLKMPMSGVFGAAVGSWWQPWRYITFQFLHSPYDLWHIGLNMLGLYMFGTPLEEWWGTRRFLWFYLTCGVTAGVAYVVLGAVLGSPSWMPLIGASGGVYGVLLACAALFPHFRIIFFFFPVPIRLGAMLIFGGMALYLLSSLRHGVYSGPFWSDVAHLGGAAMAAAWLWLLPGAAVLGRRTAARLRRGSWRRRMRRLEADQARIDRILQKVHDEGLASLTRRERDFLRDATRRQRAGSRTGEP